MTPIFDPAHAFVPYPPAEVERAGTGPLAGLSFAVKDLFDVVGYPTSGGSPLVLAMSGIKTRSAKVVELLLAAGASFVGKTVTDELAFSLNGLNAHFGAPINGAAPERISGGSSSGSASAVSNRLCDFAIGTDTGGSVRAPASHCGLWGLRPTHGRISLSGCLDLAPSLDTCGWFARDISTFIRVAKVLLAGDPPEFSRPPQLLWPEDVWSLATTAAREAHGPAVTAVRKTIGEPEVISIALDSSDAMYWAFRHIQGRESWNTHGGMISRFNPPLGPGVAERFAWSRQVTDTQVSEACEFRARYRAHLINLLGDNRVLLMPTMPDIAPLRSTNEADLDDYRNRALRMLATAGLCGLPQISMPLSRRDGAPLGLSLIGPPGTDLAIISLASRISNA
jgi:amidase